ncbi:MAG: hypothetical protein ACTSXJ_10235 [Candidatus Baldrarchaeia archaeon]
MESVFVKALSIIRKNKVRILSKTEFRVLAEVEGEHDTYSVIIYRDGRWSCTCNFGVFSKEDECSHALATKLIVGFPIIRKLPIIPELGIFGTCALVQIKENST